MPRPAKAGGHNYGSRTLVIDNGAHTIKAGFVTGGALPSAHDCLIIPNCIAKGSSGPSSSRVYTADELEQCNDFSEMVIRRPVERGFVVNWDMQLEIWKQIFFSPNAKLYCDPHDTNVILTEAPNCPQALQSNTDQMMFEEFEFASLYRVQASVLNSYNDVGSLFIGPYHSAEPTLECLLVVDSGYSHTTITPVIGGHAVQPAIRRLEIGGKLITNRLKELISLRQFNLMDDTLLVEQIKEDVCFVSQAFAQDLEQVQTERTQQTAAIMKDPSELSLLVDYLLPDYHSTFRGRMRPHRPRESKTAKAHKLTPKPPDPAEDALALGNERFVPPELLFAPSDIGMAQAGVVETVIQSLDALPQGLWPVMLANVVLVGGNVSLNGFRTRMEDQLRALAPAACAVRVSASQNPLTLTWLGGARLASDFEAYKRKAVTIGEYQQNGAAWTSKRFLVS